MPGTLPALTRPSWAAERRYALDPAWYAERQRLGSLTRLDDRITLQLAEQLGRHDGATVVFAPLMVSSWRRRPASATAPAR